METSLAAFLTRRHHSFIVIAVHNSNPDSDLPNHFFRWLAGCILVLCAEIHDASLDLTPDPYPFLLVPSSASTPLRYVVGFSKDTNYVQPGLRLSLLASEDEEGLPTPLTCALQAFIAHCTQHPQFPRRARGGASGPGVWANARHVARRDLSWLSALRHQPVFQGGSGSSMNEDEDCRVFPSNKLDPARPQEVTLPLSVIASIRKCLWLPSADPVPVPAPITLPNVPIPTSPSPNDHKVVAVPSSTAKLRPIHDVLSRLTHDTSLGGPAAYVIGYADRFDGVKEVRADRWIAESTEEEWVPLHRVRYVRRLRNGEEEGGGQGDADGEVVWWREGRWDAVFGSGATGRADI